MISFFFLKFEFSVLSNECVKRVFHSFTFFFFICSISSLSFFAMVWIKNKQNRGVGQKRLKINEGK